MRIGNSEYMCYELGGKFSHYERHDSVGNPMLRALKSGNVKCDSIGADTVRGKAANKYRIDSPAATMWISKYSGLPLYHEVNGMGGFAWAYGDGVKEPAAKK